MLGSLADAEDVVQEAFIRWMGADRASVDLPENLAAPRGRCRLSLDVLKSARRRRETYIGPWLPEPVVEPDEADQLDDDVTLPLLLALERLSPLERAAFLLHDVFGVDFKEVAETLGRDEAADAPAGQPRPHPYVRASRPRFDVPQGRRAGRSPRPSSPPRARATWPACRPCWRPTWWCTPTAAASARPPTA